MTWEERKAARRLRRQEREAARRETYPANLFFARETKDIFGEVVAVSVVSPQLIRMQETLNGPWRTCHVVRARTILRPWHIALWFQPLEPVNATKTPKLEKHLLWMYLPGDRGWLDVARTDARGITEAKMLEVFGGLSSDVISAALLLVVVLGKLVSRITLLVAAPFAVARIQRRLQVARNFRDQLGI